MVTLINALLPFSFKYKYSYYTHVCVEEEVLEKGVGHIIGSLVRHS